MKDAEDSWLVSQKVNSVLAPLGACSLLTQQGMGAASLTCEGLGLFEEADLHLGAGGLGGSSNGRSSQTREEVGHGCHLVTQLLCLPLGCCG